MTDPSDQPTADATPDSASPGLGSAQYDRLRALVERPKQIGPYHILELLGEGGFGEVYKAERRSPMRQTVAIKIIKLGFDTRDVIARFESERQALARMDHPHIAKVLDAGTTETGRPYFIMEYVAGEPITKFADDNKLTIRDRLVLFAQVCEAIAHAHTKAIIHRDIKAGNVLAYMHDGKPAAKVIDFGIAKALTGDRLTDATFNTERGHVIGTYETMSPEQAEGSPDIDTRTDVYSLGVLLYELLTGAKPFDRDTLAKAAENEIKRIIREVDPPRPSTRLTSLLAADGTKIAALRRDQLDHLARQLRSELEWIPLKAMRKERDRRYESAKQIAADISNYLDQRPLIAGPESRSYLLRKWLKRNRGAVVATAAIITVLLVGTLAVSLVVRQMHHRDREFSQFVDSLIQTTNDDALKGMEAGTQAEAIGRLESTITAALQSKKLDRNPRLPRLMHNLAAAYQLQGRTADAESMYHQALERRRSILPAGDPETLITVNSLGALLRNQNRLADAEPLLREALEARQRQFGRDDPQTIFSIAELGTLLRQQDKLDQAEPFLREAMDWRVHNLGRDHPNTLDSFYNVGLLLQRAGRTAEAEALFKELYERAASGPAVIRRQIPVYMSRYGILLDALGRYREAETPLTNAYDRLVEVGRQQNPAFREVLLALIDVCEKTNRPDDAAKWRDKLAKLAPASQP